MEAARAPVAESESGNAISPSPAASQTSPRRTSRISILLEPLTIIASRFPVKSGLRITRHAPEASATVEASRPPQETLTFSPGAAVPHTGRVTPCWITM